MSGYPIIFGEGVDPDAYQYFLRAGIASGTQTPTACDNAASFNGTNQFLSVASNSTLNLSGTNFTLSCWYFVPAIKASGSFVFCKSSSLLPLDYGFRIVDNSTTTQFLWSTSGSYSVLTGPSVVLGAWNHLTIVFDGTNLTMYGNGVAGTPVAMPAAIQNTPTEPFLIGVGGVSSAFAQYLNGQVAGFGFWKRALTASEVTQLWNDGAGRTYASLDSGLRTNLISWWALNGNSSAVSLTDSHGGNNLTNSAVPVTAPNIGPIVTTTQNSRQLINNFVKGIKSLGLWNSMVCWPLRSSQNASTTLTARSLGGLGTFDAALANFTNAATAWGSNGVITNGTTNLITSQLNYNLRQGSIFLYVQPTNSSNANYTSYGGGSSAGNGNFSLHVSSTGGTGLGVTQPNLNLANSSTANGLGFYGVAYSGGATSFSAWTIGGNNSSVSGAWGNTTGTPTILNLAYSSIPTEAVFGLMSLTMPVAVSFNAPLTQAQHIQLCLLYRSTIGLGL
jgi:hypothetical protein